MSDYEKINVRVKQQVFSRRSEAIKRIIIVLLCVLLTIGAFVGLAAIGFISTTFLVILISITICIGAFKSGWICRDIKF
jgi:uncharacterized membrane protein YfcA